MEKKSGGRQGLEEGGMGVNVRWARVSVLPGEKANMNDGDGCAIT